VARYLYKLVPRSPSMLASGPTNEEEAIIAEHFDYLSGLAREGVVTLAGRTLNTDRSSFGIVLLDCGTEERARQIMMDDPGVRTGVFNAELFPFRVSLTGGAGRCGG
jgi:uncharacterized protein YciI